MPSYGSASVGTTPTPITSVSAVVSLINTSGVTMYIGGPNVTTSNYVESLPPNMSVPRHLNEAPFYIPGNTVYGVVAAGSANVNHHSGAFGN